MEFPRKQSVESLPQEQSQVNLELIADEIEHDVRDTVTRTRLRKYVKPAALLLLAVGVVVAVVLSGRTRARGGVAVPERISATFHAEPQDGTTTPYEGRIHKVPAAEGSDAWKVSAQVSFQHDDGNVQTVTVLDNRAYWSLTRGGSDGEELEILASGCVPEQDVPPYNDLSDALNEAVEVPHDAPLADYNTGSCGEGQGKLYTVAWAGQVYVYCSLEQDIDVHQFVGQGFVAAVFDVHTEDEVADEPDFVAPTNADGTPLECPELTTLARASGASSPSETRRRLVERHAEALEDPSKLHKMPWYLRVGEEASREERHETIQRGRQLTRRKTCIFVHAWGTSSTGTSSQDTTHWGDVHTHTSCHDNVFIKINTQDLMWDDPVNMNAFCQAAAGGTTGQSVSNKRIFSYGYGSLTVAAALEGTCQLATSSKWYVIAPPTQGNVGAEALADGCGGFFQDSRACAAGGAVRSGVSSLLPTHSSLSFDWASYTSIIQTKADGIMCGNTPYGVNTASSVLMTVFDSLVGNKWRSSVRDGWTELDICQAGAPAGTTWSTTDAGSNYFVCSVNALDLTCAGSNGWVGGDEKLPCNFYAEHGG